MARRYPPTLTAALALLVASLATAQSAPPAPPGLGFYASSLHATARGIEFVYSKEQGGLERITGLPAAAVGCVQARCHASSCDDCHRKDVAGKPAYSLDPAVAQAACERCHGAAEKDDPDVHVRIGMKCMTCHSTREVHGDGVAYDTYAQPGVLETRCEKCHPNPPRSASHDAHAGKLECGACHTARIGTCVNCHVETRIAGGKSASIKLDGMLFLVNRGGRVTTANVLSYVYKRKTMITVAPTFGHATVRKGRACADCHDTAIVRAVSAGTFAPVTWRDGGAVNARGVIPVTDPLAWNLPFLDRKDGAWLPLAGAAPPVVQFSGGCAPLTREQLARLAAPQPVR